MTADGMFIIDAVAHPYNHDPSNYADVPSASAISELSYLIGGVGSPNPIYDIPHDVYVSDWPVDDVANVLFKESPTDIAVVHALPIFAYKDGFVSIEKAADAVKRYPERFRAYGAIDPLLPGALEELERQVELFGPTGIKVYPTSWNGTTISNWKMNDPKVAFPFYEKALELGVKCIAVHKAVPLGPIVVGDAFDPADLEGAAGHFPDLAFEIVHGGIAFTEETAWLMARFENIYVNLEVSNIILERRPRTFSKMLLDLLQVGGMPIFDRLIWGTGCVLAHPQPTIEAFLDYEIPEDLLADAGLFAPITQITREHKEGILAGNFARIHGIDIEACKAAIADDDFSRARAENGAPEPWSTVSKWDQIQEGRGLVNA